MSGSSAITGGVVGSDSYQNPNAKEILVSWTGATADGAVPSLLIDDFPLWFITKMVTKPLTPAPTTLYDITGTGPDGEDIFDSQLLNRSATVTQTVIPIDPIQIPVGGMTLTFAGQDVSGGKGQLRLTINK